jgi:hypothetical protein
MTPALACGYRLPRSKSAAWGLQYVCCSAIQVTYVLQRSINSEARIMTNKLDVGKAVEKLRGSDEPKSRMTILDEKNKALDEEIRRLRAETPRAGQPEPWTIEQIPGGYKVKDAHGQSLAYVCGRETRADAASGR